MKDRKISSNEDPENEGGGRMLGILLIAAATIAILYFLFGRKQNHENTLPESAPTAFVPSSSQNNDSRIQILEEFKYKNIPYLYIKDTVTKLCFIGYTHYIMGASNIEIVANVSCEKADPNLRNKEL